MPATVSTHVSIKNVLLMCWGFMVLQHPNTSMVQSVTITKAIQGEVQKRILMSE
jgi:hypothetical protein